MARLPAAQKRALEAAWEEMRTVSGLLADEKDMARLDDMLKRMKRVTTKDDGMARLVHAAYMRKAPTWSDEPAVAEASLFGIWYADSLDRQIMQDGALVHDRDLDDPRPVASSKPAPETADDNGEQDDDDDLEGMDLL